MRGQCYWIRRGKIELVGRDIDPAVQDEESWLARDGFVRFTTGELGTEVKWNVNSPCTSSLIAAAHFMATANPPFVLRFHAVGWFEEVHDTVQAASQRMEEILTRGDRYFASRTFMKETDPNHAGLPQVLRYSLESNAPPDDYTVDCAYDQHCQHYVVRRVGPKSAIGRVWGTYPSSHPCQSAGNYGDAVSEAYEQVLQTGKPRYDQVLAALRLPDNAVYWVPYHRIVFPRKEPAGHAAVAIVSQIAQVDFRIL